MKIQKIKKWLLMKQNEFEFLNLVGRETISVRRIKDGEIFYEGERVTYNYVEWKILKFKQDCVHIELHRFGDAREEIKNPGKLKFVLKGVIKMVAINQVDMPGLFRFNFNCVNK